MRWDFRGKRDFVSWDDYEKRFTFRDDFFFQQNTRRQSVRNLKFFA